ncbi:DUF1684 domain-containing protein [uncultured Arcticibacterium sp.]|uniref:DUF1684 domain-containing protein n=1 Tax=uncultured Arcticibacterium sp. TaxID=2173042 RepID=UPI0030F88570
MFKNKYVKWVIGVIFVSAAIYSLTMNQQDFTSETLESRETYKNNMLKMEQSPVAEISNFNDFRYFDPKEKWKMFVDFESSPSEETFPMVMTDQSISPIKMAGYAIFTIEDKEYRLMLFDEGEHYLLPFTDGTNGDETYGGGRYINVEKTSNNKLMIDFNEAHNFYCVYNENFVCPVPPSENDVAARIDAGEKILFLK